ncbi:hypothetical protein Htur_1917 [Haloterrigena turkmenica DSM 5511]|uniref:Glutamate--cysteine ligase GCS2 n=1 Tax=Haloterrigena turkmenica (strain ATCC 51198 / DSM 5511 / JCM 9101 / NCIMB 13204 / VKM B-1734 / 4k) TaxID=543526 RepID=D2RSM6_HALTV|nr:hypothetical protein [Haloterrigena turkmenica]ADB60802.1 hypothetical protein Htur_1917 [Haloterrigena turkmenica DSM 5511]
MADPVALVARSLADETRREFDRRVDQQAAQLTDALRAGRLDSPGFGLGLELEAYAVDEAGRLARVPDAVFEGRCERELGRHNVEFNTEPTPFDGSGIAVQAAQLERRVRKAQSDAEADGLEIVLDAMWTRPPPEGAREYLAATTEREGVALAENMTESARYYAIDNDVLARTGGEIALSVPGVEETFPSLLFESLTSSVQPHVQIPDVEAFPRYYNTALGTLGPVLALATNSPLLPPDLYDFEKRDESAGPTDPYALLEATHHELRIPVFEQSVNRAWEKVRVPRRIERTTDAIDRLVADQTCAPFLREWLADGDREEFADRFWELDHKRGTYWRWLRTVVGGQPVAEGDRWSVRLEYRPLPTQPTVAETVGLQCLVAGLLRGLVGAAHPIATLEREAAAASFYDAVANGLEADLAWITADGDRTSDRDVIYDELFAFAHRGLREQGVSDGTIETYLGPFEARWRERTTPSRWKLERVRDELDAGERFADAVHEMQAAYVRRAGAGEPITQWS